MMTQKLLIITESPTVRDEFDSAIGEFKPDGGFDPDHRWFGGYRRGIELLKKMVKQNRLRLAEPALPAAPTNDVE